MPAGNRGRGRLLSVFSGAGGLDLGLELAGFDPILCLDSNLQARQTLRTNRTNWLVPDDGDVTTAADRFRPGDFNISSGELHLLAGGPPCQPFSKAAQWTATGRSGLTDPRAKALHGLLALAESFLPEVLLIENVPGFVSGPESALRSLQLRLAAINRRQGTSYRVLKWIIDSADYGVPQHRRRAIVVAFRDGRDFCPPDPTHAADPVRAWDALHDCPTEDVPDPRGSWTPLLASIPEGNNYQWLTARGGGVELFGWRTRYWSFLLKLAKRRPAWTLPASPGPNTGPFHWDNRPLSTRERMRLQSFPDQWVLRGAPRDRYRMAGNATPPLLAEVLGRALVTELQLTAQRSRQPRLLRPRESVVPPASEILPVPPSFAAAAGPKDPHPGSGLGPSPRTRAMTSAPEEAA
jgi:DNA (cytosine-5)-methyltransferase 1